jgi:Bifunctional DNA primase/polymerase, N-terminal/Primase C terminal 2 (PriCT-2)
MNLDKAIIDNEINKKFMLSYLIDENKEIKRFFPLYNITIAKKCACNNLDCDQAGKHPKVLWRDNKNRSKCPISGQQGFATGDGIIVLDCDINEHCDGWLSLVLLAKPHGGVPDTPTIITGSGGKHLYFRSKKKFKNKIRFADGLDLRAEGGYVVFPISKHISGNNYRFDDDLHPDSIPVADLPIWLEELLEQQEKNICYDKNKNEIYDPFYVSDNEWEVIKESLDFISSDCTRDEWRKIGMCLFNSAREEAFEVWDNWCKISVHIKRKNRSIYNKKDNEFQWNTQFHFAPVNLPLEILEIAKIQPPEKDPILKSIEDKFLLPITKSEDEFEKKDEKEGDDEHLLEAVKMSHGFVKDYYNFAINHSRYAIKKLHFLAAFSAISAVAQSSFLSPTRCSLSLYQLGFANTGRGKDDVLYFLQNALMRVNENLLSNGKYTSLNGLLMDLYDFNSKIQIADEAHTYLTPILKALPTSPLYAINGELMKLWSHRDAIEGVKSKSFKIPSIQQPKLSMFALSSFAGIAYFKDKQAINSGFLNRFLVSIARENPQVQHENYREPVPESFVEFLQKIFKVSENEDAKSYKINFEEEIKDHEPQRVIKKIMAWDSEEAKKYFHTMVERIDLKRDRLTQSKSFEEHDMYSRYAEQIIRLASLHALGCARGKVSLLDLKLAEKMVFTLAVDMLEFLDVDLKDSQFSQYKRKILSFIKTQKRTTKSASLREVTLILGTKTSVAEETLDELVAQNILAKKQIINKNATVTKTYHLN